MPEESINIFISNIYTVAIFTGVFNLIFIVLFLVSRSLHSASARLKTEISGDAAKTDSTGREALSLFITRKDIFLPKTLFALGLIFIYTLFFLLIIIFSIHFTTSVKIDGGIYIIFLLVFLIILCSVYAVRSKIFK